MSCPGCRRLRQELRAMTESRDQLLEHLGRAMVRAEQLEDQLERAERRLEGGDHGQV